MHVLSAAKSDTFERLYRGNRQGHQNRVSGGGVTGLAAFHIRELTWAYYDTEHSHFALPAGK